MNAYVRSQVGRRCRGTPTMQSPQCFACVIVGDATRLGTLSALEPTVLWQQAQRHTVCTRTHRPLAAGSVSLDQEAWVTVVMSYELSANALGPYPDNVGLC